MGALTPSPGFDPANVHVVVMGSRDMEPAVPRGSILFLGAAGYAGQILYSLPSPDGQHDGNIRRLTVGPSRVCTFTTDHAKTTQQAKMERDDFVSRDIRPVVGMLRAFHPDFERWAHGRAAAVMA